MAIWLIRAGVRGDGEQKLICLFEDKIKAVINRVWGETA